MDEVHVSVDEVGENILDSIRWSACDQSREEQNTGPLDLPDDQNFPFIKIILIDEP